MKTRTFLVVLIHLATGLSGFAHPGHDGGHDLGWDFSTGLLHPLGGADHLLAALAVGIWAAQLGRAARWAQPSVFLGGLVAGALLGRSGASFGGLEQAIAASVLVLGLLVMTAARTPLWLALPVTASFALFHGMAHGVEMPHTAGAVGFGAGLLVATACCHVAGLGLGAAAMKAPTGLRQAGGALLLVAGGCLLAT